MHPSSERAVHLELCHACCARKRRLAAGRVTVPKLVTGLPALVSSLQVCFNGGATTFSTCTPSTLATGLTRNAEPAAEVDVAVERDTTPRVCCSILELGRRF